jgi:NAD(P)-dependent dehydrogenase (short-subunit alcohol dehydrogenase family)
MAIKDINVPSTQELMPAPSSWWCQWQALQGTNPRTLSIPDVDLRGKWIILTGGNSGIGREASLQFAKWGANIIIGCRRDRPPREMHPDAAVESFKAAALKAGHHGTMIQWWKVDMSNLNSVEAFGNRWLAENKPLDILANNAGTAGTPGKTKITHDGFELVHQARGSHYFNCCRH